MFSLKMINFRKNENCPSSQKLLAFQGAFEKLFNIIDSEGGVDSRVNVESALTCVDALLRFNSANQVWG